MKYLISIFLTLIPYTIVFAGADPEGMFQGAVNPYQTMAQGAVQTLTIVGGTTPPPPAAKKRIAPKTIIISKLQQDEKARLSVQKDISIF
ncbi:MAG: hypothetical protein SWO11_21830 [Thermodesulfobacteriota bacterium]|nr:hypothetical protein [Thermodesulfobacteriota bacterium]